MSEIIEDTITRNRKFREEQLKRLKRLKECNVPKEILEHEEFIAGMTVAEFEIYKLKCAREDNEKRAEYVKNNPIQQTVVDEIYNRLEKLEFDSTAYWSEVFFHLKLAPLDFMSNDDFHNGLYDAFLTHARELYQKKYVREYEESEKERLD